MLLRLAAVEPSAGRPSAPALRSAHHPAVRQAPLWSAHIRVPAAPAPAPTVRARAPLTTPPGYKPGFDLCSRGLPPRVTRKGASLQGLQVLRPSRCRATDGLTPHPQPLHPARRPLDGVRVGRGWQGRATPGWWAGTTHKREGEREAFSHFH